MGPPMRVRPPTSRAAASSASHPPLRWAASASAVTGMSLSPEVVPDVFTQSRQRPGQSTEASPAAARAIHGWCRA
jgi:hypothetical protein